MKHSKYVCLVLSMASSLLGMLVIGHIACACDLHMWSCMAACMVAWHLICEGG
jgi:hypothetical protein